MIHRPPISVVCRVMPSLDKLQTARLVRGLLKLRTPEQFKAPAPVLVQLQAYVYEWLLHLGFVSDGQAQALLAAMTQLLRDLAGDLEHALEAEPPCPELPVALLTIADRTFAAWPGLDRFYHLVDNAFADQTTAAPVTHIVCDLTALFLQKQRWLTQLQEGKDDRTESAARGPGDGDPEGPGVPGRPEAPPPAGG
jgi:hypothetical protein